MKLQITADDIIGEEFKQIASEHNVTQKAFFEFLLVRFIKSGTPQTRAGQLKRVERKKS